jgi:hypothetical protein
MRVYQALAPSVGNRRDSFNRCGLVGQTAHYRQADRKNEDAQNNHREYDRGQILRPRPPYCIGSVASTPDARPRGTIRLRQLHFFCSSLKEAAAVLLSTVWLFDWAQLGSVAATVKMKSVGRNAGFENEMYRHLIDRLANAKGKEDDLAN